MPMFEPDFRRIFPTAGSPGLYMALIAGALFLSAPAQAQQPAQPAKPAPAPAGKAPADKKAGDKKEQAGSWVKLCEKQKGDKKGNVCLTHHERFHPTTGQPLVSTAIRKADGAKQDVLMVMVPLGRLLPAGLLVKVDEQEPIKMNYAYCTALGCVAETPATPELIGKLKKGTDLAIGTIDISRRKIGFKIPLLGFTRALDGPPIDRKVYAQARKAMFDTIRKRQSELIKRAKEAAEKKKEEGGGDAPAPKKAP